MSYQREYLFPSNQEDFFKNLTSYESNNSFDIGNVLGSSQETIISEEFFAPLTNESEIIKNNVNEQKLNSKLKT
ncbi:25728_t:CDS:2, partial [Racocetra persica]